MGFKIWLGCVTLQVVIAVPHCSCAVPLIRLPTVAFVPLRTGSDCGDCDNDVVTLVWLNCADAVVGAVVYVNVGLAGFPPPDIL